MDLVPPVGAVTAWQGRNGKDSGRRPPRSSAEDPISMDPEPAPAPAAKDADPDGKALLETLDRMVAVQPAQDEDSTRILRGRKAYQSNPRLDLPLT